MAKVSKLDRISYYTKLYDLYDTWGHTGISQKLLEVVDFLKKYSARYEEEADEYDDESKEFIEILQHWRRAFEDANSKDSSWGIYIVNGKRKMQVNIRPIMDLLRKSEEDEAEVCAHLQEHIADNLVFPENLQEWRKVKEIITLFQLFFNDFCNEN